MANVKQAILKKKIGDIVFDLMIKTTSAMVYVDDTTTLATKLTTMLADIKDSKDKLSALLGDDAASSITGQIETAVQDAVDALTNENDPTSLAGKIKAINGVLDSIQNESTGILATAKSYTDEKLGLSGTSFNTMKDYVDDVKNQLNNSIAGAFHFKGTVNYVDNLPTKGAVEGDVYQVKYMGTSAEGGTTPLNAEYAYDGTAFVELGSIVDLSAYSTTAQMTSAIATAKSEAISAAATDATNKANTAKSEAISAAATDATNKANTAKSEAIAAAATDATSKADAAKAAAIAAAATDATNKANAAKAGAEATAAGALANAVSTINATMATKARFIVSASQPSDLTEADIWAQLV